MFPSFDFNDCFALILFFNGVFVGVEVSFLIIFTFISVSVECEIASFRDSETRNNLRRILESCSLNWLRLEIFMSLKTRFQSLSSFLVLCMMLLCLTQIVNMLRMKHLKLSLRSIDIFVRLPYTRKLLMLFPLNCQRLFQSLWGFQVDFWTWQLTSSISL